MVALPQDHASRSSRAPTAAPRAHPPRCPRQPKVSFLAAPTPAERATARSAPPSVTELPQDSLDSPRPPRQATPPPQTTPSAPREERASALVCRTVVTQQKRASPSAPVAPARFAPGQRSHTSCAQRVAWRNPRRPWRCLPPEGTHSLLLLAPRAHLFGNLVNHVHGVSCPSNAAGGGGGRVTRAAPSCVERRPPSERAGATDAAQGAAVLSDEVRMMRQHVSGFGPPAGGFADRSRR